MDLSTTSSWITGNDLETSSFSIAEMVAEAASNVNNRILEESLPGYVYCSEYNMWYNSETGYYFDSNTSLFYHSESRTYYYFNEDSQTYEIYSHIKEESKKWTNKRYRKRGQKLLGKDFLKNQCEQIEVDVLEILFELVDRAAFYAGDYWKEKIGKGKKFPKHKKNCRKGRISNPIGDLDGFELRPDIGNLGGENHLLEENENSSDDDDWARIEEEEQEFARRLIEEENSRHASCIRLIEESIQERPILHIVTITGANFGFNGDTSSSWDIPLRPNEEKLDDNEISAPICSIVFCSQENFYQLKIFQNLPIFVNGILLKKNHHRIEHRDRISIGKNSKFLVHIHTGINTCSGCEPGLLSHQTGTISSKKNSIKRSKESERRRNLRQMKEQYGIDDMDEELQEPKNYVDRANKRRREFGIIDTSKINPAGGIYSNCRATPQQQDKVDLVAKMEFSKDLKSTQKPKNLESNNKGFQLLKNMGWEEGKGLGKNQQGIQGPIETVLKTNRSGFGSSIQSVECLAAAAANSQTNSIKFKILEKTRQRYAKAQENVEK